MSDILTGLLHKNVQAPHAATRVYLFAMSVRRVSTPEMSACGQVLVRFPSSNGVSFLVVAVTTVFVIGLATAAPAT